MAILCAQLRNYRICASINYELSSQLGPKPTRPKPSRPKTNSAQNQVGPKPTRPKTHSALILLLSSSLSSFLFLSFSSSSIVCITNSTGNWFPLKECQSKKFGNLERCIKLSNCYHDVNESILFGMGMSQRIHFWYQIFKNADFFSQKMTKNHFILIYLFTIFSSGIWKETAQNSHRPIRKQYLMTSNRIENSYIKIIRPSIERQKGARKARK